MKRTLVLVILVMFFITLHAQQKVATKQKTSQQKSSQAVSSEGVFGVVFSDYSYVLQEPQPSNKTKGMAGANAFELRRAQIGYEHSFNKEFMGKITYDASLNALQEGYLSWNYNPWHTVTFGMSKSTAEATEEKVFGYRSLAPMMLTKNGFEIEYDKGITLNGKFDAEGSVYYDAAIANGSSPGPGEDKLKAYSGNLGFMFDKHSVLELYVDFENLGNGRNTMTAKLFYGFSMTDFSIGAEGFYRMQKNFAVTNEKKDVAPAGVSLFGWFEMVPTVRGVLRVDFLEQDLNNGGPTSAHPAYLPSYRELYVNAGLDYSPIEQVHIIPNIVYVKNLKKNNSSEIVDTVMAQLTAAVYFPEFK
jgi:hypothetical protein